MKPANYNPIISWTYRSGFAGASFIFLGILVSALFYIGRTGERYSFCNHFVSELGEVGVSELAAAFNGGLVVGATLLTFFMLGIAWLMKNWLGWLCGLSGLITGLSGMLVGVFPMSNLLPHIKVAMTFFNNGQITMLLFSLAVLFNRRPWFCKQLAIPGLITFSFFVLFLNMPMSFGGSPDIETATINLNDIETAMRSQLTDRPRVIPLAVFEWLIIGGLMAWILITSLHLWRYQRSQLQ